MIRISWWMFIILVFFALSGVIHIAAHILNGLAKAIGFYAKKKAKR